MSADVDLLVVGAGAKAAAIAAKVHAINRLGLGTVSLLIVEDTAPAASWSGINGMTSGDETLAITPYKDIGFPYESSRMFGERGAAIDTALAEFSWQGYLIETGGYARWLNAGQPPIRHRDYGLYLAWVLARATEGVEQLDGRVTRIELDRDDERWVTEIASPSGPLRRRSRALTLTGPGIHRPLPHDPAAASRIFHCDGRREELGVLPTDRESSVAIVGGGEGALSCATYLRKFRPTARLTMHTPSPPLSRGESFVENRVYSDPDCIGWEALDVETRRTFIRHTDRGVFGPDALSEIAHDDWCDFAIGRVTHVGGDADHVRVEYLAAERPASARYDYVVNCTGFDLLGQVRPLFPAEVRDEIEAQVGPFWDAPAGFDVAFGRMLEVEGLRPRLHLPGLSALSQGPGFANLGCLGLLANRVLQAFVLDEAAPSRERTVA